MRIAYFTPLAPLQTALADHSEGLLPYLALGAEIDLFIDEGYQPSSAHITNRFGIYSYRELPGRSSNYDLFVYVMGNNFLFHGYMDDLMRHYPGVVILHDTEFQEYFLARVARCGTVTTYVEEMAAVYGESGRRAAASVLNRRCNTPRGIFSLVEPILDCSAGAVVYNEAAYRDLLVRRPQAQIWPLKYHYYLPAGFPSQVDVGALRARWGLEGHFVIGTFGLFTSPDKRIEVCLKVFKRFLRVRPDALYLLVGSYSEDYAVPAMVRANGLENNVILTGWMDALDFAQHLCVPDVAIHLRYPHLGGTLYTPIRLLGLGIPTIMSDIGPLQEFPEGCCAKISHDEHEEETLLELLCYLAEHAEFRRRLGENGQLFTREHHAVEQIARQHLDVFEHIASRRPRTGGDLASNVWTDHLIRDCATALARWGVDEAEDALLRPTAGSIARTIG